MSNIISFTIIVLTALSLISCDKNSFYKKNKNSKFESKTDSNLSSTSTVPGTTTNSNNSANPSSKIPILQVVTEVVVIDSAFGTGPAIQIGADISLNYSIYIYDPYLPEGHGKKIESTFETAAPLKIKLGSASILKSWQDNLVGMKKGGKRILILPPKLAYGALGIRNKIPPHSPLLIEIELL